MREVKESGLFSLEKRWGMIGIYKIIHRVESVYKEIFSSSLKILEFNETDGK